MDIRKLQRAIVDGLEDVKAQNIVVFNTEHLSPLFERVIIASGTSNRQTKALASSVRETVKGRGMAVMRTEGEDNGEWIIVDCGAAVVHVMQPAIRDYYHLEEIWGDKPVKLKLGSGEVKLVKASEPEPVAKKAPAKKAPAAKTTAKTTAAKKAAPAKKGVTRVVGAKTPVVQTIKVGAAKPAAKKAAPAKKTATKAAPAKKVAAKAPAAKKPVAKKAASKPASKKA
ncbi:ribosome silencing factor [Roseateles sp. BYS87W]|uniref:Ribosomal silencing factor RsfS n=1 Tax=Pelomonas baiyunensis TaxID=3299026 RepID=A0ABW7GUK1_9BURK